MIVTQDLTKSFQSLLPLFTKVLHNEILKETCLQILQRPDNGMIIVTVTTLKPGSTIFAVLGDGAQGPAGVDVAKALCMGYRIAKQ